MRSILIFCLLLLACLPAPAANNVVSLSHYDDNGLSFARMRREGIDAVIHECTYPPSVRDAKYAPRQREAVATGMLWGAYHFGNATGGRRQADHFLSTVAAAAPRGSSVLLILDAERHSHYPGGIMPVSQAVEFIKRVHERTGKYPGVYSNENWVKSLFNGPAVSADARETLRHCWLWIANYHYPPKATAPWSRWTFWQYTGDGICDLPRGRYPTSIAGRRGVERTIFNGSSGAMRSFWAAHAWTPGG